MLVRTDPSHHRLSLLSIPRDLYVPVPSLGYAKINAAFQAGGPALAIKTVHEYTSVPINHVVVVNFNDFKKLIDAEGGITVNVPQAIVSNRFDCPYKTTTRCDAWRGWRFPKGKQHMNGERALIYSRIRENRLNAADNDLTRGARQQAVIEAATAKLTSFGTPARAPVQRRLADQAARDRPHRGSDPPTRLAQVPRLGWRHALLPARAATSASAAGRQ